MLNWVELSQFRSSWKKSQRNYWKYFTLIASILCCIITSTFAAIVLTISNPSTFTTSAPSVWNRWKLKQSHLDWLYWNIYLLFNCPKRQRLRQRWSKWDWYKNIALDVNTHLKGFFFLQMKTHWAKVVQNYRHLASDLTQLQKDIIFEEKARLYSTNLRQPIWRHSPVFLTFHCVLL